MVKIRLQRHGAKKRPVYVIVAANSTATRDGEYLDRIGMYFPKAEKGSNKVQIDAEKLQAWISRGAQMTDTVSEIVKLVKA